ncbi:BolA family protein [Paraferrimonas sp. SM1919]|uniref:BolA family protein n=1 Tax=Paraferrimonas sp. SM1919 TaxID=2662263 RepID=UPI0013D73E9F|nr:BolA/IbaG family iron-sulfur metabolism protein [Paraferrimonas sp. SM1919]
MDSEQVKALLLEQIVADEIRVSQEGTHYKIIVVGEQFGQMRKVKQQQTVYAPLMDKIKDGTLHAITIKAFTPEQWQREKLFNL